MDDGWNALWMFIWGAVVFSLITGSLLNEAIMREALDRGYAVQCVGKSGIYWECE